MDKVVSEVMTKMIVYFADDVQRIHHTLKVHGFASSIGKSENIPVEKQKLLEIAAILHDIGIKESERKYGSGSPKYQHIEGPPVSRQLLEGLGLDKGFIDRICFIVGNHHAYDQIDDQDFQILVEADFLVNIYEGKMEKAAIESVRDEYFKTDTGKTYLESMFFLK